MFDSPVRTESAWQYYDGKASPTAIKGGTVNENGDEVPVSFRFFEKVPDGTPVFVPKAKP